MDESARINSMNPAATTLRHIMKSSKERCIERQDPLNHRGFYHRVGSLWLVELLNLRLSLHELAQRLINAAEVANTRRETETVKDIAAILTSLPLNHARNLGLYYHALSIKREGKTNEARAILENLVECEGIGPHAVINFSLDLYCEGRVEDALRLTAQAAESGDVLAMTRALWNVSLFRSFEGDNRQAIDLLDRLFPLVRFISRKNSFMYYCWHNDVAYELLQLGKIEQAAKLSAVACSSRFADVYPEWRETREEIEEAQAKPVLIAVPEVEKAEPEPEPGEEIAATFYPRLAISAPPYSGAETVQLIQSRVSLRARIRAPSAGISI